VPPALQIGAKSKGKIREFVKLKETTRKLKTIEGEMKGIMIKTKEHLPNLRFSYGFRGGGGGGQTCHCVGGCTVPPALQFGATFKENKKGHSFNFERKSRSLGKLGGDIRGIMMKPRNIYQLEIILGISGGGRRAQYNLLERLLKLRFSSGFS
jgi:hypothetical protein